MSPPRKPPRILLASPRGFCAGEAPTVEVATNYGSRRSRLVRRVADMDGGWLDGVRRLGITAGASALETLVDELIAACRERHHVTVEEMRNTDERVELKLPRALVA